MFLHSILLIAGPKRGRLTPGFSIFVPTERLTLVRLQRSNSGPYTFIKGQRDNGTTQEHRNKGTTQEQRDNTGTKEHRNKGTKEPRNRNGQSAPIWSRLQLDPQSFEAPAPALSRKKWSLKAPAPPLQKILELKSSSSSSEKN